MSQRRLGQQAAPNAQAWSGPDTAPRGGDIRYERGLPVHPIVGGQGAPYSPREKQAHPERDPAKQPSPVTFRR